MFRSYDDRGWKSTLIKYDLRNGGTFSMSISATGLLFHNRNLNQMPFLGIVSFEEYRP